MPRLTADEMSSVNPRIHLQYVHDVRAFHALDLLHGSPRPRRAPSSKEGVRSRRLDHHLNLDKASKWRIQQRLR